MIWVIPLLLVLSGVDARSDYVTSISPHANTAWGSWGPIEWCPFGHYAYGFQLKVEGSQGSGDDTAVNGVRLHCRARCGQHVHDITSSVMVWGSWGRSQYCPSNHFIQGVSMKSEPWSSKNDDTAVNNFSFLCQSTQNPYHSYSLMGKGMPWGSWSSRVSCPNNSYICGIKTRVEREQGRGDDTALNDAIFYCCRLQSGTC